jgi:N-acetylglutamate synthase-like GNAT family acetyltransferase
MSVINMTSGINIIPFETKYSQDFYNLNVEWLKKYFEVEPYDEAVLSNPDKYIIEKKGYIFLVEIDQQIIGTAALMPTETKDLFELTKMAVSPRFRGFKIGQTLLNYCIDFVKQKNHKSLILYSSRKLENAIYIYRKKGFVEIPVEENCHYKRCDIKMKLTF